MSQHAAPTPASPAPATAPGFTVDALIAAGYHPAIAETLQYFNWQHLPEHLRVVSEPIGRLAYHFAATIPSCPQLTIGLNNMLTAKDAIVRAALRPTDSGRRTPSDLPPRGVDHPGPVVRRYMDQDGTRP